MFFAFIESRLNNARLRREATERADTFHRERMAKLKDPSNWCDECAGDGEVRVRGLRTVTGMEMCYRCGGSGLK